MANDQRIYGISIPKGQDRFQGFSWDLSHLTQISFAVKTESEVILELWGYDLGEPERKLLWFQGGCSISVLLPSSFLPRIVYPVAMTTGDGPHILMASPTFKEDVKEEDFDDAFQQI